MQACLPSPHLRKPTLSSPEISPIKQNSGITAAEKYLAALGRRTFLSLWRYPGLFREPGKELCDLLVVFENDVLIFSDKDCAFPASGNIETDWGRWFRKAIEASVKQLLGAKRWVEKFPERLFLDSKCSQRFPIDMPAPGKARFHLVSVVHGIAEPCTAALGGSGSLMIDSSLKGPEAHKRPFWIGDLEPQGPLIHVLDDTSLEIVLKTRDTVSDLVEYLRKKEKLLRGPTKILAAGEQELLAVYLTNMNADQEHDFPLPKDHVDVLGFREGHWADFETNPQRIAQAREDRISYAWDSLIEVFNKNVLNGTQYRVPAGGVSDTEKILRFMAREPRLRRRMLAGGLIGAMETTAKNMKRTRVLSPSRPGDPWYAFLLLSAPDSIPEERYRFVRSEMLQALCMVVKLKFPEALDIVGFATEAGRDEKRSEDVLYFDARSWTTEHADEARRLQQDHNLLTEPTFFNGRVQEYPEPPTPPGQA